MRACALFTPALCVPSTSQRALVHRARVTMLARSRRESRLPLCSANAAAAAPQTATPPAPITLSDRALSHVKRMRDSKADGGELVLRMGVKSGGCSGMSYFMDFEEAANVVAEDTVMEVDGFKLVCDPKSLLYLFGMQLDYSDELIGGGFQFQNPNAESTCGCGKSFGV